MAAIPAGTFAHLHDRERERNAFILAHNRPKHSMRVTLCGLPLQHVACTLVNARPRYRYKTDIVQEP
jgi:hypothetical protein